MAFFGRGYGYGGFNEGWGGYGGGYGGIDRSEFAESEHSAAPRRSLDLQRSPLSHAAVRSVKEHARASGRGTVHRLLLRIKEVTR